MILVIILMTTFIGAVIATLVCGIHTKAMLYISLGFSVGITGFAAFVGTRIGLDQCLTMDSVWEQTFDSVSVDLRRGYKPDGEIMELLEGIPSRYSDTCRLVVLNTYLYRRTGWWSHFDILRYARPVIIRTMPVLYTNRGSSCQR